MIRGAALRELTLRQIDGGLNLRDLEYKINDNQSPDMINMWYKDRILSKRWGQAYALENLEGDIHAISELYNGYVCIACGTKLYKWEEGTSNVTDTGATIADTDGAFAEFNSLLYYFDGTELWQIASDYTVTAVTPYVPTVYINALPDFSGSDANEAFNLIGGGFKVTYNGDGESTTYTLPLSGLDDTPVKVLVNNVELTEDTHFTVNRTNGTIDFTGGTSPHGAPSQSTNNVEITAYKTVDGNKDKIAKCTIFIPFGGEGSSATGGIRLFAMGNPDYPSTFWYSDLALSGNGAAYWPDTQYEILAQNSQKITAAGKQYGELIIFKTRSTFAVNYIYDTEGISYTIREVNSGIGCDMPGSVQLIDNRLVFANTYGGVYTIVSTANIAEENIKPISGNVNGTLINNGILQESLTDLQACSSVDYESKYWLCIGDKVYLWDYDKTPYYNASDYEKAQRRLAWYRFDNISAKCFYGGASLYYGVRSGGKIVRFIDAFYDFGKAINARWKSKAIDFGAPNYEKTIYNLYVLLRAEVNAAASITAINDKSESWKTEAFSWYSFSWNAFDWNTFTFNVARFSKPSRIKLKMKKTIYFQVLIENNSANSDIGLTDIVVEYTLNKPVKR